MKKTFFFLLFVAVQTTLFAEEYYPDGTKWTEIRLDTLKYDSWYSKVGEEWVPNFETIEYYVKGEFIDKSRGDGKDKYKCVYTNGPEWTDSLTLFLQEEGDADYVGHDYVMVSVPIQYYDWNDNLTNGALLPGTAYQFDWSIGKGIYFEDILYSNTTGIGEVEISTTNTYNVRGELTAKTNVHGNLTTSESYTYDALGRMTASSSSDGSSVSYAYDDREIAHIQ